MVRLTGVPVSSETSALMSSSAPDLLQGALDREQLDRQKAEEEAADARDALQKVEISLS